MSAENPARLVAKELTTVSRFPTFPVDAVGRT
jgi:hypothetical protein